MTLSTKSKALAVATCWMSGSVFRGRAMMRLSVVGWQTTAADIDLSADAILAAFAAVRAGQPVA